MTDRPDDFTPTQSQDSQTDLAFSPSVGLAYQPWKPITLYANYTESFAPQTAGTRSFVGSLFNPERGKAYEGGVKFQFFEERLRATIAGFHIKKRNVITTDPVNGPQFSVATGEQRSHGERRAGIDDLPEVLCAGKVPLIQYVGEVQGCE